MSVTTHATLVFERSFDVPPARVFEAFADPQARMRWGTPSADTALVYLETDFRVGGRDVSRCGHTGNLIFHVENRYVDIVADRRIVSTEIVSLGEQRLSVALITVDIKASGKGTHLVLTDQIVALDGSDLIAGNCAGLNAALDNLERELRRAAA
jgi:uncharacterized protein YndB with AHSA1/START domain